MKVVDLGSRDVTPYSRCLAICVAGFLVLAATMKFASGYEDGFAVGRSIYYAAAVLELLLAAMIMNFGRTINIALWGVAVLCLMGSVYGAWFDSRPCGCFGSSWVVDNATHSAVNAIVGILCVILAASAIRRRSV